MEDIVTNQPQVQPVQMSLKFYEQEHETAFNKCVEERGSKKVKVFNEVFKTFLEIPKELDDDAVDNLIEISEIVKKIEWKDVSSLLDRLRQNALTRSLTKADLVLALIKEGLKSFEENVN